jgi:hypothetical protein
MPIVNTDPLLGQLVEVTTVDSGGFLVKQLSPAQVVETYCVNMDEVSAALNLIFTPPTAP